MLSDRRRLVPVARGLWEATAPQSFFGLPVGARMTVVRLVDDRLLLHSPIALDRALRSELDALGTVAHVIAPNRLHHLYAGPTLDAYPNASLWVAPGLETKRRDLPIAGVLSDVAHAAWAEEIDQVFVRGRPFENEVVFFHRPTNTLIVSDLAFNFGPSAPAATRLAMKLIGSHGRLGPTSVDRLLVRDGEAARQSLERIMSWDFDRVIVAHGDVAQRGGKEALRAGYRWLLEV